MTLICAESIRDQYLSKSLTNLKAQYWGIHSRIDAKESLSDLALNSLERKIKSILNFLIQKKQGFLKLALFGPMKSKSGVFVGTFEPPLGLSDMFRTNYILQRKILLDRFWSSDDLLCSI